MNAFEAGSKPSLSLEEYAGHLEALRYQFELGEGDDATRAVQELTELNAQNPIVAAEYAAIQAQAVGLQQEQQSRPSPGGRMSFIFGYGNPDNGTYIDF